MRRLFKTFVILLTATAFYTSGFWMPQFLNPDRTASVAEAGDKDKKKDKEKDKKKKKDGDKKKKKKDKPPTISELPIQYMLAGGLVLIIASGGVYLVLRRNRKRFQKA